MREQHVPIRLPGAGICCVREEDARHAIRVVVVGLNTIQRDPVHCGHRLISNAHIVRFLVGAA
jgi:hypothetical protein